MVSDFFAKAATRQPLVTAAALITVIGLATIGGFFYFQYVLRYPPCPLCLEQRNAYYICVPLAGLLWLGASHRASRKVMILGFAVIVVAMLWNAGLSAYHAGIEWKFWQGPADCSGSIGNFGSAADALKRMQNTHVVRCDEAAWRLFGLSLAGYDVLVSLALAAIAACGARIALARKTDGHE
jgi:disulfide bond formation protein DsbB